MKFISRWKEISRNVEAYFKRVEKPKILRSKINNTKIKNKVRDTRVTVTLLNLPILNLKKKAPEPLIITLEHLAWSTLVEPALSKEKETYHTTYRYVQTFITHATLAAFGGGRLGLRSCGCVLEAICATGIFV